MPGHRTPGLGCVYPLALGPVEIVDGAGPALRVGVTFLLDGDAPVSNTCSSGCARVSFSPVRSAQGT